MLWSQYFPSLSRNPFNVQNFCGLTTINQFGQVMYSNNIFAAVQLPSDKACLHRSASWPRTDKWHQRRRII